MDHYIDIRLRADPEFPAYQLLEALYSKLHRALVQLSSDKIGVSFPDVSDDRRRLGQRLRLHGSASSLQDLSAMDWLKGMRDHVKVDDMKPVPETVLYRAVQRVQVKSSPDRIRRRLMRRQGICEADARKRIPDSSSRRTDLPFVTIRSQSTGQAFPLFIRHGEVKSTFTPGTFSCYGLSQTATVPWF